MRVVVDAMGGDHAPGVAVRGALDAVRVDAGIEVILVGREDEIRQRLPRSGAPSRVRIVPAADVLEMHESPVEALRRKPDTSIARSIRLLADGEADAVVSAGNTGGAVAAAALGLAKLPGARRAGIAAPFPTRRGHCVLMDVGANLQPKATDLVEYAVMASEYARAVLGVGVPRVGVLSVGGEEDKGRPLVRQAADGLRALLGTRCVGNVEGQEIFAGDVDVIICEGFVGNVILKASEGLLEAFVHHMLGRLEEDLSDTVTDDGGSTVADALDELRQRTDYTRYGGAPLMGHDGAILICHGRSPAVAIRNAVRAARSYVSHDVNARIAAGLAALASNSDVTRAMGGNA